MRTGDRASKAAKLAALRWARRGVAFAIVVGGVLALNANRLDTCEDRQSIFGAVSKICHRPTVSDPVVLGTVLVVLLLLAPDITEFSVFGLASMKLRLRTQEARVDATEAELAAVKATVAAIAKSSSSAHAAQSTTVNLGFSTGPLSAIYAQVPPADPSEPSNAEGCMDPRPDASDDRTDGLADTPVQPSAKKSRTVLARARLLAGDRAVATLLADAADDLRAANAAVGVVTHLYLPNDDGLLLPVDEPSGASGTAAGAPAQGAVGEAWIAGQPVIYRDHRAQDDAHRTPSIAEGAEEPRVVYAIPVMNASGRPIGVLCARGGGQGDPTTDGQATRQLTACAVALARVVIDLLRWASDD